MAFFDEMKQRVSHVGQSASKSAKEFSETSRLNGEITAAKNKINQLYNQIGYAVYCAYSTNPLPEAADLIAQVNILHEQIESCQAQIQAIAAASRCPGCGAKIHPGMTFCSSCGAKLPQPEPAKPAAQTAQQAFCPNCGTPQTGDSAFCPNCGFRMPVAAEPVVQAPAPTPAPVEQPRVAPVPAPAEQPRVAPAPAAAPSAQQAFCPNCGTPLSGNSAFCLNCGFPVPAAAAPAAAPAAPTAYQPAQPSVCPGCGEPLPAGATFCINCGTKLG